MKAIGSHLVVCLLLLAVVPGVMAAQPQWRHLSSKTGDLPVPGASRQQTASLVLDVDRDGVQDFIIGFRQIAPALVLYRRESGGWKRYVIEPQFLTIEAGGAVCDIDGDGDPDVVFGGDWQSDELWWWENPAPNFDPKVPWRRHIIKPYNWETPRVDLWINLLKP